MDGYLQKKPSFVLFLLPYRQPGYMIIAPEAFQKKSVMP
ncbi:hypothetical protein VRK_12940 [Vibrio sp. MEBiC08052]|nr:hypothetical protein VRK_12940 [Vibrio sp. MEBiC08052]